MWGSVQWAYDARGLLPAREIYETLEPKDKARLLALFQRHCDNGPIRDGLMFRPLGASGGRKYAHLFEFKANQWRFLGDYRGRRFLTAHGVRKKQDRHREADLERAARILIENDEFENQIR